MEIWNSNLNIPQSISLLYYERIVPYWFHVTSSPHVVARGGFRRHRSTILVVDHGGQATAAVASLELGGGQVRMTGHVLASRLEQQSLMLGHSSGHEGVIRRNSLRT